MTSPQPMATSIFPNATSKLVTTVPHGYKDTMIGGANGGGLDGYMDMTPLSQATQ